MSTLGVLALAVWLLPRLWAVLSPLLFPSKKRQDDDDEEVAKEQLAELNGGPWERLSVWEHIEGGLKKNADGIAVMCTFQPSKSLGYLVSGTERVPVQVQNHHGQNGLWERQSENEYHHQQLYTNEYGHNGNGVQGVNGTAKQQNFVLWGGSPEQNGYGLVQHRANGFHETPHPIDCLTLTYAQLHRAALRLAAGLLANGCRPNTTMVMLIPNSGEYAVLLWTCVLLRITYVSLDPASLDISGFTSLKETLRMLKPQIVVAPDHLSGKAVDVAVAELELAHPVRVCLSPPPTRLTAWKSLAEIAANGSAHAIDEAAVVAAARRDHPERIHSIMFTSGTGSLRPKACPMRCSSMSHVLRSQSWLLDRPSAVRALQQPHNSRAIAPAQTLQTWSAGGAVVMTGNEFSVSDAVEAIRRFGVTFLVLTPPMVHEMAAELAAKPVDVSCVRKIQVGGDAVTKGLLTTAAALFPLAQVCVNHGMTEGGGSFAWPFFGVPTEHIPFFGELCPVGAVAPGSLVRIWDTGKKRAVKRGQLGELHVSSPSIIRNYFWRQSDESFYVDQQGRRWFNTGDMATVDRNGLVFIMGRKKDMILRAGVGVMPAAIESTLGAFVGSQTIVVPVPHHVLGTEPFAVLSSYNGKTEAEIKDHVRRVLGKNYSLGGLASLKQLGLVGFPLNQTHKIVKSQVQLAVLKYMGRSRDARK